MIHPTINILSKKFMAIFTVKNKTNFKNFKILKYINSNIYFYTIYRVISNNI